MARGAVRAAGGPAETRGNTRQLAEAEKPDFKRTRYLWLKNPRQWLWRATHSRLGPFTKLAKTIRAHRDGILAWTTLRVTNGALEGMVNKVKAISHRAFGFRTPWTYMANIYRCCAALPLL